MTDSSLVPRLYCVQAESSKAWEIFTRAVRNLTSAQTPFTASPTHLDSDYLGQVDFTEMTETETEIRKMHVGACAHT